MGHPRHSVSVTGVVTDDEGRVLVVQRRDNGRWELPGGILELDEAIPDGMRREVEEETGISAEPIRLTGVYKNLPLGVVALVYRARRVSGEPQTTAESAEVAWWTRDQIAAHMREAIAIRAFDALSDDQGTAVRLHDGVRLISGVDNG